MFNPVHDVEPGFAHHLDWTVLKQYSMTYKAEFDAY